jgi:hypothetical protein
MSAQHASFFETIPAAQFKAFDATQLAPALNATQCSAVISTDHAAEFPAVRTTLVSAFFETLDATVESAVLTAFCGSVVTTLHINMFLVHCGFLMNEW